MFTLLFIKTLYEVLRQKLKKTKKKNLSLNYFYFQLHSRMRLKSSFEKNQELAIHAFPLSIIIAVKLILKMRKSYIFIKTQNDQN